MLMLVLQGCALLWCIFCSLVGIAVSLPGILFNCLFGERGSCEGCVFYEGKVFHCRRKPVKNDFTYPVRLARVDLDNAPHWFRSQAADHWSADKVRETAGTQGSVKLLTSAMSCGYIQNPISVYMCYDVSGAVVKCIVEVTNTPWGGRVNFLFDPKGETVAKALHVSPLMDMTSTWTLKGKFTEDEIYLTVRVAHPENGNIFDAVLALERSQSPHARNERCGFKTLIKFGFQPHKVAFWIYYQAWRVWRMGAPLYDPPNFASIQTTAAKTSDDHLKFMSGDSFIWGQPQTFPWNVT